jgi:hypothetical protein
MRSQRQLARWLRREIWGTEAPVPRKPARKEHRGPARNWKYRQWIRSLPCACCGQEPAGEAAHTGQDGGMSQRSSDWSCVPLCPECHRFHADAYHRIGRAAFEEKFDIDFRELCRRLQRCWFNASRLQGGQFE